MTNPQPSLFARPDTFFGVCQGMGEDLGVHPNLFRVAFALAFFFVPLSAVATYFLLGAVVAGTRYALPIPAAAPSLDAAATTPDAITAEDDLQLAA